MLYIYDINELNAMREAMEEYTFYSIAHILQANENINELDKVIDISHAVIDITSLIHDNSYYQIFIDKYLVGLYEISEEIHFSLQTEALGAFKKKLPHLIDDDEIDYSYQIKKKKIEEKVDVFENKIIKSATLPIYTYKSIADIVNFIEVEAIISLSDLLEDNKGISFNYDSEKTKHILETNDIEYVDITSLLKFLELRADLIFTFEKILKHIVIIQEVSFIVDVNLESKVHKLFPLIFKEIKSLDLEENAFTSEVAETTSVDELNLILDKIEDKLKGHVSFKKDFRHNLLKFYFLKEMKERKILSILICGESGVGKTEFAKITSETMYSNEPLIKINFGNYSTEGVLNSLIGSPLGYVGSEEGGELPNKIATSKSKVILIDEFERATPSVFNFFYELLEDGKFTDRHGDEHDLEGYIIIFTSNMMERQYIERVPDSLKSRFDMVYNFEDLELSEKTNFINYTATDLIQKISEKYSVAIDKQLLDSDLIELINQRNLRDIKRMIEDIVFVEFFKIYIK